MKNFFNKIIDLLPYGILMIIFSSIIFYIYEHSLDYDRLVGLIEVLIWPFIVLCAIIFFRKVFTYLFLSIEEFNFFGSKVGLKNARDLIEEKVEIRIEADKKEKENKLVFEKIKKELNDAKSSQEDSNKKAKANLELATEIFKRYKTASNDYERMKKDLEIYRKNEEEREARMMTIRERMKKGKEINRVRYAPTSENTKETGDTIDQQKNKEV